MKWRFLTDFSCLLKDIPINTYVPVLVQKAKLKSSQPRDILGPVDTNLVELEKNIQPCLLGQERDTSHESHLMLKSEA